MRTNHEVSACTHNKNVTTHDMGLPTIGVPPPSLLSDAHSPTHRLPAFRYFLKQEVQHAIVVVRSFSFETRYGPL